jgi:hypothetical protein
LQRAHEAYQPVELAEQRSMLPLPAPIDEKRA